jgi:hypothetical protein
MSGEVYAVAPLWPNQHVAYGIISAASGSEWSMTMNTENSTSNENTNTDAADAVSNYSTTEVGHTGANDDDPTGAKAAGGLVNSDIDTEAADEGNRPTATGAHRGGALGTQGGDRVK